MLIDAKELREDVIRPILKLLSSSSYFAENLLLGTAAQESQLRFHLTHDKSISNNGLGLYQISHDEHWALWDNYLAFQPDLASIVRGLASQQTFLSNPDAELTTNLDYATAIAWLIYQKNGMVLPEKPTVAQLSTLWEKFYTHKQGDGKHRDKPLKSAFITNFNLYIHHAHSQVA